MSAFAVDEPRPAQPGQLPAHAPPTAGATHPAGVERQLHAQDSDQVYQAAGNQYIVAPQLPTPVAAANTLPRDIVAFTGRGEELDGLSAVVTQLLAAEEILPVIAIDGMPGVGKTTFAVHTAHRLSPSFPDGRMFIDMHAHTAGKAPVEPADALFALLSVDGVRANSIPDDVDGRSALWRARMAGRRSILILDNVIGSRQVDALLPGSAGCLVLVTSRRRLTGLGARHAVATVALDPLPPGHAAELFARLTGRAMGDGQEQTVTELVRLCGCLPLAISLLAARLRPEPQWQVRALVEDLATAQDRLAHMRAEDVEVAAAFNHSYRRLPAAQRRLFRFLGLSPGTDIDAYAAAALAGVGLATARRHLDAFYDDHLVDQPVQGRYRLHDLLGAYARNLAAGDPAQRRELAVERLLDYYQHTAGIADGYLAPRPRRVASQAERPPAAAPAMADVEQAAAWMEAELPNLLACATYAMSRGDDVRLIGLSAALAAFLRGAGRYEQSVALQRAAADAASRRGDRTARAAALHHVGMLLGRAGDYPAATEVLAEARDLYRNLGDHIGEAEVLTVAGIVQRLAGDYGTAAGMLDGARARFQELADPAGQARALDELAVIRWLADDYPAAIQLLDQALALHRQAGSQRGQADVLLHLGMVGQLMHDYPAATRAFQRATALYRGLGARMDLAHAQFNLGVVHRLTGDYLGAAGSQDESLRVYEEVGDRLGRANALRELGIVRRLTGDHHSAAQALLESLSLYQDLGNRKGQAGALQELGELWRLTGDTARAAEDLAAALATYQDLGTRGGQTEVLNHLGTLALGDGDPQALDRFHEALRLAREVHNPLEEARALVGIGRCALHLHDTGEAVRHLRTALEIHQRIGSPEASQVEAILTSIDKNS